MLDVAVLDGARLEDGSECGSVGCVLALTGVEVRRHLRSFRFLVGSALLVLLSGLVAWLGHADHQLRSQVHESTLAENRAELERATVYSFLRPVLSRPPEPLALFERGASATLGSELEITPFEIPHQAIGAHRGNPYLARWLALDLTTVVAVVFGLLALLSTFDALVEERSSRRLELLRVHGVTGPVLFAGKLLGAMLALAGALAVALGPPVLALFAIGALEPDAATLGRLLGLFLVYAAYGLAMALLGLWISLWAPSEPRSLAYALLAWFGLVFLLPEASGAINEVVTERFRDPRALERRLEELEAELEARLEATWQEERLRREPSGHTAPMVIDTWDHEVLRRLGSNRYHESLARYYTQEIHLGRLYAQRRQAARVEEAHRLGAVARRLDRLAWISPITLLERSAEALAGTSASDHEAFVVAAREYRRALLAELEARGVLGTRPWFTDDPPEGLPWVSFLGLEPDDVGPENISEMATRFRDEAVEARVEVELARRERPESRLDLSALPTFELDLDRGALGRFARTLPAPTALALLLAFGLWRSSARLSEPGSPSSPRADDPPRAHRHREAESGSPTGSAIPAAVPSGRPGVLRAELRELCGQARWRLAAALIVVSMVGTCLFQALHWQTQLGEHGAVVADYEASLRGIDLSTAAGLEHPALRPPSARGFLVDGGERSMPAAFLFPLSTWQLPELGSREPAGRAVLGPAPPDWAWVVWVVSTLMAFLLGYDAFTGRRLDRSTLLVALGRSRGEIALGRWGALVLSLAGPLVLGAVLGLAALVLLGGPGLGAPGPGAPSLDVPGAGVAGLAWIDLGAFFLSALFGLGFFSALALGVSAWLGRADEALVTLVLVWVSAVVVIPSASAILVLRSQPVPTEREVAAQVDEIGRQIEAIEGSSDWRPGRWARVDDFAAERRSAGWQLQRYSRQRAALRSLVDRQLDQAETARRAAYLSPVVLFEDLTERLLGAGLYRQRALVEQAERFDARLRDWAAAADRADPESPHLHFFPRYLSTRPIDAASVPRFHFVEPSLRAGARRARATALALFVACGLLGLALRLALRRAFERDPGAARPRPPRLGPYGARAR